jgi:hypothetical protein
MDFNSFDSFLPAKLLCIAFLISACCYASANAQAPEQRLEGIVTYQGQPVQAASVLIQFGVLDGSEPPNYQMVTTDGSGRYGISFPCPYRPDKAATVRPEVIMANGAGLAIGPGWVWSSPCSGTPSLISNVVLSSPAQNNNSLNAGPTCSTQSVGAPINVTNGNMWINQSDYYIAGVMDGLNVSRTYNSVAETAGVFGYGWSSDLDLRLETGLWPVLHLSNGRIVNFAFVQTNTYTSVVPDFYGRITVANGL